MAKYGCHGGDAAGTHPTMMVDGWLHSEGCIADTTLSVHNYLVYYSHITLNGK